MDTIDKGIYRWYKYRTYSRGQGMGKWYYKEFYGQDLDHVKIVAKDYFEYALPNEEMQEYFKVEYLRVRKPPKKNLRTRIQNLTEGIQDTKDKIERYKKLLGT